MNRRFFHKQTAKKTTTNGGAGAGAPPPPPRINFLTPEYKQSILDNSYLTAKGFTIPKQFLHPDDITELKRELSLKKIVQGPLIAAAGEDDIVYAYRENEKKIYIPRYYAAARYGTCLAENSKISAGEDMSATFHGTLRDYQEKIVDCFKTAANSSEVGGGGLISLPCGRGKCLAKDTEILMYDGTVKVVQDIKVGDVIMGDDSTPRNVLSLARGRETMYKVKDETNIDFPLQYTVNKSHILSLKYVDTIVDISIEDYLRLSEKEQKKMYGFRVPIEFTEKTCNLSNIDVSEFEDTGIPHIYKCNTTEVRLRILYRIIEKYGKLLWRNITCGFEITHKSEGFINDIIFISRSLGYIVTAKTKYNSNEWLIRIFTSGGGEALNYRISLERLPEDEYYGFEIDGNRRFVLGDFTVTHNTIVAIKIATELRKKTLIIVHKEFLLNQWVERIRDFCGGEAATIGRIQGDKFEIEGKDFVIGMLQTLYSRSYPEEMFRPFGLLIIDETHRICSEQFSRALFKFSPRYTLGISATISRKDGLDTLLNMFVGDIVYHEDRNGDDPVCVRAMEFVSGDPEFEKVEYDFRGNVQFSTMISKLCEYVPRAEFVLRIVHDLFRENPEQQIMILAHNKNVLHYLHDAIRDREMASVGYYLGGMKERDLKETEDKQVVIATYAMAAEALDIKTLSTLIMVTPKKDITQSVGRILRMKHENPIVVDVVDTHDVFQNQWKVRRAYYKKCNYRIRYIKSPQYAGMCLDWDKDTTWKRVYEPVASAAAAAAADDEEKIVPKKCLIDISRLSGKSAEN